MPCFLGVICISERIKSDKTNLKIFCVVRVKLTGLICPVCEQKIETTHASDFCSLYSCEFSKEVLGGFNVEIGPFLALSVQFCRAQWLS